MSKALPGEHYCEAHQGNHSHYAPGNCTVCKLRNEVAALEDAIRLVDAQLFAGEGVGVLHYFGVAWGDQPAAKHEQLAMRVQRLLTPKHTFYECPPGCDDASCPICQGDLRYCIVCKKGEAELDAICFGPLYDGANPYAAGVDIPE